MANRVVEEFDKQIQIPEARAAAMKAIREALARDPDFVTVIQEILPEPNSNGKPAPERAFGARVPDVFDYERTTHGMLESGNEWLAIREISRMTPITRGCINNVLYTGGH